MFENYQFTAAERFQRYVQIDTQSDPQSSSSPTTEKQKDLSESLNEEMNDETIRLREEISMQCRALEEIKSMALKYGFDISKRDWIQHIWF